MDEMARIMNFARILSDETRQNIMLILCCEELSVTGLVDALQARGKQLTQPTVSHHLAELRSAGFVKSRRQGRHTFYSLNQDEVMLCCGQIRKKFAPDID
jgi:DNA-binding transcriptional ArsR family regulator